MHRDSRGRVIWDKRGSPSEYVARELGLEHWQVRQATHKIKGSANLHGDDRVIIHENGDVTDENDEEIGNIFDES